MNFVYSGINKEINMKLIKVSKVLVGTDKKNYHYINIDHIVEIYRWSSNTVIMLSIGEKIECSDHIDVIINQLKLN